MTESVRVRDLPRGIWLRRLPWKVGAITLIRDYLDDKICTIFEFEFILAFPITLILNFRYREFFPGAEVQEHRDGFEPIYGCSVALLVHRAIRGGEFKCEKTLFKSSRLYIFNGTRYLHSVSRIDEGSRKSFVGCLHFAPWPVRSGAAPSDVG